MDPPAEACCIFTSTPSVSLLPVRSHTHVLKRFPRHRKILHERWNAFRPFGNWCGEIYLKLWRFKIFMPQALKNQRCYIIKVAQEREDSQRVWFPINESMVHCVECLLQRSLIWADVTMHLFLRGSAWPCLKKQAGEKVGSWNEPPQLESFAWRTGGAILTMSKEKHHKYHRTSNALANLFVPELSPICLYILWWYPPPPPKKKKSPTLCLANKFTHCFEVDLTRSTEQLHRFLVKQGLDEILSATHKFIMFCLHIVTQCVMCSQEISTYPSSQNHGS